jgi:uncharacterized protein YkwD
MLRALALICLCLPGLPALACPAPTAPEIEAHLSALNAERARAGRPALAHAPDLGRAAQAHACDMARRGYFSHTSPGGQDMVARARNAGATGYCMIGENIAQGHRDIPTVIASWMRSAGHRRNILDGSYTHVGLGLAPGPVWVQVFAGPC